MFQILMCLVPVADVEAACNRNTAPGITKKTDYALEEDVDSIPAVDVDSLEVSSAIVMKTGKRFFTINHDTIDSDLKSNPIGEGDATAYEHVLTLYVAGTDKGIDYTLGGLNAASIIALNRDKNNAFPVMLGAIGDGATMTTARQTNPKSGYIITIKWTGPEFCKTYSAAVPYTPAV